MTGFSLSVQSTCIGVLTILMVYTLWLMRTGRLNAHVTVRWILAESAAGLAVVLWAWLPFFKFTSTLDDRELLIVLAIIFFALIAVLILDCLVRISTHTYQIKLLTQELALLGGDVEAHLPQKKLPIRKAQSDSVEVSQK